MKTFSRWRYERAWTNNTCVNGSDHPICIYSNPRKSKYIFPNIGRIMIKINYNKFITLCFTKKIIFVPFPWDWFYNIKKEKDYIINNKQLFMNYWYRDDDISNNYTCNIIRYMRDNNCTETDAYLYEKERIKKLKEKRKIND